MDATTVDAKAATGACPMGERDDRKTAAAYEAGQVFKPGAEIFFDAEHVKATLRSPALRQCIVEDEDLAAMKEDEIPFIYLDGKRHRDRRKQITNFFTPRAIKEKFEPLMKATADRLVSELERDKRIYIDEASWQMAVTLVGEVIGVTRGKSHEDMKKTARRIERVLYRVKYLFATGWRRTLGLATTAIFSTDFLLRDVRPTIRARKEQPQDDVISYLIEQGYSERAILVDAMTLCGAGMQTTREFISLCAWHLLENAELRAAFVAGDYEAKMAIIEEILRLEPIVATLYRKAPDDISDKAGGDYQPGRKYGVSLRHANIDPAAVGECPLALDPKRKEKMGDQGGFLSFGNGMHRCPGSPLALNETLFLMDRLLAVPGVRLVSEPKVEWIEHLSSFQITDVLVTCD